MSLIKRSNYYQRLISAYLVKSPSQLTFWHDTPEFNPNCHGDRLGEYYMVFSQKADYPGPFDNNGIPKLNYHGTIGVQYNPIAIAQYGLANYNQYQRTGSDARARKFFSVAEWLVSHLEVNDHGVAVWNHHFDWDYRNTLKAPWYSGLAQGQGISVLVRAFRESGDSRYAESAERALAGFFRDVADGGVIFTDPSGDPWIEEYIVAPPTHILNGFIWSLWGLLDYSLLTGSSRTMGLFNSCLKTVINNLARYDIGYWSLYELGDTRLHMIASPFYHSLHITQLRVMLHLTGLKIFRDFAEKWERCREDPFKRTAALAYKAIFKLCYY